VNDTTAGHQTASRSRRCSWITHRASYTDPELQAADLHPKHQYNPQHVCHIHWRVHITLCAGRLTKQDIKQWINYRCTDNQPINGSAVLPIIVIGRLVCWYRHISFTQLVSTSFYHAAWNADAVLRWEFCPSVRPSIRPSVRQTRELWQKGRKICLDFYIIRKNIYPSFLRRRMVGGSDPSTWNFGSTGPRWSEIADFEPIIARSTSAVRLSEKSSIKVKVKVNVYLYSASS